jgi:uncharacterized membrane protein
MMVPAAMVRHRCCDGAAALEDGMDFWMGTPGLTLGVIGWAATNLVLLNVARFNDAQKRLLVVISWMVWMVPAFDSMVRRSLMSNEVALQMCGGITLLLALVISVTSIRWRTDP